MIKQNKKNTRKNKGFTINLQVEFLLLCSLSLGLVVCALYFFVIGFFNNFERQISSQAQTTIQKNLDVILKVLNENNTKKAYTTNIIDDLHGNLISEIFIFENNKIVYATNISIDKNAKYSNSISTVKKLTSNSNDPLVKKYNNYTLYAFANSLKPLSGKYFELQINIIFICALVLCFIISWMLPGRIIKSLNSIKKAAKEFAKGNFKYRIAATKYNELNAMIAAYHMMAKNLQLFYATLEKKVHERTVELERAIAELKNTQSVMVHSEKMKSLGGLVAGITHEINNPVNFIYGNLAHLNNYTSDLISVIEKYSECDQEYSKAKMDEAINLKNEIDFEFIKEDLPALIKSCREGTERTKNIIQDLKNFSRMDANVVSVIDLKKEIDTTLNILTNKLKNRITIHKENAENVPPIEGMGGQLNQVFMNILDNAAYAIKDKCDIFIRLKSDKKHVLLEFEDNGSGMSEETMKKIFEPFYTTKPTGIGTGLGMSISYKVIRVHSGTIKVDSIEGQGTVFRITLPIKYTPNQEALAR